MSNPLFVLSSGRCGSTLFQQMLNATGECAICGEHGGILSGVAASFFEAKNTPRIEEKLFSHNRFLAWENIFTEPEFDATFGKLVEQLFRVDATKFWGFKEISYGYGESVPEFLREVVNGARFIVLTRHPVSTITSQMKAWESGNMPVIERAERWQRQTSNLLEFAEASDSHILRYEDFTDPESQVMEEVLAFHGLKMTSAVRDLQVTKINGNQEYRTFDILSGSDVESIRNATINICERLGYEDFEQA